MVATEFKHGVNISKGNQDQLLNVEKGGRGKSCIGGSRGRGRSNYEQWSQSNQGSQANQDEENPKEEEEELVPGKEYIQVEATPMQIDASTMGRMDTMLKIVGKSMM